MRILKLLIEKEFKQFFRNSFLPKMVILYPLLVMLIIPLVTSLDVKNVKVSIVDINNSNYSTQLIQKIKTSNYFELIQTTQSYEQALHYLEKGKSDVILEIPNQLDKKIDTHETIHFDIAANAVVGSKGLLGGNYLHQIIGEFLQDINITPKSNNTFTITPQYLYNEQLDQRRFMIPALVVVLLILMCGLLPALNIVLEKERGTIEQLNVTPISKKTFILAKLIPYWLMGLIILTLCFIIIRFVWGMTPIGSYFAIYVAAFLLIFVMTGIGLTLSNFSNTLQQALFVTFFIVMIFMLLSGLFTPVKSMPTWANYLSLLLPPRYFIEIIRSIYLKGSSLMSLQWHYLALTLFAIGINILSIISYRKQS